MSSPSPAHAHVLELMRQKDALQTELDAQYAVLASHNVTVTDPLVDAEGFPRADVDVYAVRHARVRIIELRNDLAALIDKIAKGLEAVFPAQAAAQDDAQDDAQAEARPFARVDGVAPGSPAAAAVRACARFRGGCSRRAGPAARRRLP